MLGARKSTRKWFLRAFHYQNLLASKPAQAAEFKARFRRQHKLEQALRVRQAV
jgi:hypothetical protein